MKIENMPTETGIYWAKCSNSKWFNLLVEVYGNAPFLKIRGWNRTHDRIYNYDVWEIDEWGFKIEEPPRK